MNAPDLRLGRWESVLADVGDVDALICDPPYSARTHDGHNGSAQRDPPVPGKIGRVLGFEMWTPQHVADFVRAWAPRVRGWFAAITSHDFVPAYEDALNRVGRYVFAPLPFYSPGSRIRLAGDGPSNWTCWIVVARPKNRAMQRWGTLPGGYSGSSDTQAIIGGKPLWLMRALVRDYSRPGDLVCDPCAGGGTTLAAARLEGRRSVGAEMDPKTYEIARRRLAVDLRDTADGAQLALGGTNA